MTWAIPALADWRTDNRAEINRRAAAVREAFATLPEWGLDSLGAYFAYVRHPYPGTSGKRVAERLAAERGALCLPGSAFGAGQDGHLRLAFANADVAGLAELPERLGGLRP